MKQVLQNLKSGETSVVEVPSPQVKSGHLKIKTNVSLISAGTERMLVDFGKANYINKARQQPEKVAHVIRKINTDGLAATVGTVMARLDELQPLGYSNVGVVLEVGNGVTEFKVGDRVVSNGRHAEIVNVPQNLCAKIPDNVSDERAAFTIVSSIGLQGIRLTNPTLGESCVVYGLGLIGLLTAQMLKANGCRALGIDVNTARVQLAKDLGIEAIDLSSGVDPIAAGIAFSGSTGVDAVLITASTKDDSIVHCSAQMCRKRGRIVLVGVTGLKLNRSDFYEKELSFQVSCSYGPGRYDPFYEEKGNDYPLGFVRWTEQRNFKAVLALMESGAINTETMVSAYESIQNAPSAYEQVINGNVITVLLKYPEVVAQDTRTINHSSTTTHIQNANPDEPRVAVIGAGNFTKVRLMPALKEAHVTLDTIVSSQGISSASAVKKFGFMQNSNDTSNVWNNTQINTVFITTRHDSHGNLVKAAIENNKHVFVEKPLTILEDEFKDIQTLVNEKTLSSNNKGTPIIMVGFNRRFAALVQKMKQMVDGRTQPLTAIYTVNAGNIPVDHWTQSMEIGGGRILGEACHFIDLLAFLVGKPITAVTAIPMGSSPGVLVTNDKVSIILEFEDGSHGTIHYFANGSKRFSKERIEIFSDGRIAQIDNFRDLKTYGFNNKATFSLPNPFRLTKGQDKGHTKGFLSFIEAVRSGKPSPIPFNEIVNTTEASFAAVKSASIHQRVVL
ncbi:dehydrogenase [Candidatus Endobugula sertula]|uniref:Dehydrogenase n=1 Tax=Candidatus Endobugula sertula TaxID=62101 RepID=A0A1D2QP64_9GAMM|nr:dehydrogenase [Candidatus Endobugula sertula]